MLPVRPEMQKAGPSTRVTVPPVPRDGLADDVQGLVTGGHVTRWEFPLPPQWNYNGPMSDEPVLLIDDLHAVKPGTPILRGYSHSGAPGAAQQQILPNAFD